MKWNGMYIGFLISVKGIKRTVFNVTTNHRCRRHTRIIRLWNVLFANGTYNQYIRTWIKQWRLLVNDYSFISIWQIDQATPKKKCEAIQKHGTAKLNSQRSIRFKHYILLSLSLSLYRFFCHPSFSAHKSFGLVFFSFCCCLGNRICWILNGPK